MRFCRREFLGLLQVGQKVFLESSSEERSGTDGTKSGGERVGPGSIDKVRYAFSATFFGHGFKKVALRNGLYGRVRFYY